MNRRFIRLTLAAAGVLAVLCFGTGLFAQTLSDLDIQTFQKQRAQYEVKSRTDPFAKGVSAANDLAVEDLQLSGIVYRDENHAYALISGYLVRPGDRIAGYRVDAVEKDKVRLKRLDEVFVLALGGGI